MLIGIAVAGVSNDADAQWFRRRSNNNQCQQCCCQQPAAQPAAQQNYAAPVDAASGYETVSAQPLPAVQPAMVQPAVEAVAQPVVIQPEVVQPAMILQAVVQPEFVQPAFVQPQMVQQASFAAPFGMDSAYISQDVLYDGPGDMRTHLWSDHSQDLQYRGISYDQLQSLPMSRVQQLHNEFHADEFPGVGQRIPVSAMPAVY